jgi:hypothetical protein
MDSAYAADGKPGRDFLQASTRDELFSHLRQLREQPELRQQLVLAGRAAGSNFSFPATLDRWQRLLGDTVPELAAQWRRKSVATRRFSLRVQAISVWLDTLLRR